MLGVQHEYCTDTGSVLCVQCECCVNTGSVQCDYCLLGGIIWYCMVLNVLDGTMWY